MNVTPEKISCEMAAIRIDYRPLARELLAAARAFYADPQNEAEYQAWRQMRERGEQDAEGTAHQVF